MIKNNAKRFVCVVTRFIVIGFFRPCNSFDFAPGKTSSIEKKKEHEVSLGVLEGN